MALAELLKDQGLKRMYRVENGSIITLELDELNDEITFHLGDQKLDGEFCFIDEELSGSYLLARMYSPKNFKKMGLGRAAIQFFIDYYGCNVYTRPNDGQTQDDGSHLTEDAPGFVSSLQKEGIIKSNDPDYFYYLDK